MDSKTFFAEHRGRKDLGKQLKTFPALKLEAWELEPVSKDSPGRVGDDEVVYQQILDPTNLDESGTTLDPMAFDTASGVGMSTNRLKHISWGKLVDQANTRAAAYNLKFPEDNPRALWGFVPIPVRIVRSIISKSSDTRGLYVFDTATEDDKSHADICQGVKEPKDVRSVRHRLYDMVKGNVIRIADVPQ